MSIRIGINGYGRMGRLALRAGWNRDDVEFVAINEVRGDDATLALITERDSVQGRFSEPCSATDAGLAIGDKTIARRAFERPEEIPWAELGVELVLECSGRFRRKDLVGAHLRGGARRVVVSAPVSEVPNIVVGVNHDAFDLASEEIVTAASCTTNCLAPVVRVLHDEIGIRHGLVTTIHDPTNTQVVHDLPHKDPRRSRSALLNLVPTSTNSATAVTTIIPELKGRLDSIAVRAPVLNASLTDLVFEAARPTTVAEVNGILARAANSERLSGILGYEESPLVSSDYAGDPRSGVVDALSTRVTDSTLVKVFVWYDNEWGYANRMVELAAMVGARLSR